MNNPVLIEAIEKLGGPTKASHVLGVSVVSIHNWKSAGKVPRPKHAIRIADLTGLSLRKLLGALEEPAAAVD